MTFQIWRENVYLHLDEVLGNRFVAGWKGCGKDPKCYGFSVQYLICRCTLGTPHVVPASEQWSVCHTMTQYEVLEEAKSLERSQFQALVVAAASTIPAAPGAQDQSYMPPSQQQDLNSALPDGTALSSHCQ